MFSDRIGGDTFSYIIVGTKQGVYAYKDNQWRCLFSGASGGDWGFLTYQDDDDTLLIFGNGLDPVQLWNGETPLDSALPARPPRAASSPCIMSGCGCAATLTPRTGCTIPGLWM